MKKVIKISTKEVMEIVINHLKVKPTKNIGYNPLTDCMIIEYEE